MVITGLTRNQLYLYWYRGFESHRLRQKCGLDRKKSARKFPCGFFIDFGNHRLCQWQYLVKSFNFKHLAKQAAKSTLLRKGNYRYDSTTKERNMNQSESNLNKRISVNSWGNVVHPSFNSAILHFKRYGFR